VNALEGRLRAELQAESELIRPQSIPGLNLPGRHGRRGTIPRAGGRRRWPVWGAPLAAAAAVLAIVAGTLAAIRMTSGTSAQPPAPGTSYRLPAYYAVTVSGDVVSYASGGTQYASSVLGRSIQIRATATGKLVATVSPPAPYNNFPVLTGTADGRTFVFGAERYWGFRGVKNPLTGALDPAAPLRFVLLRIGPDGRAHWSALSVPLTVLPGQQPSIALSPDGTKLAVAYGGGGQDAVLRVFPLGSGVAQGWLWPRVPWTPLIQGQGTWTADGRTLVLQQWAVSRSVDGKPPASGTPPGTTAVRIIDTSASAVAAGMGRLLTLRGPAGLSAPWQPFITPDGSKLIATTGTGSRALLAGGGEAAGEFAVYSTRDGALIRIQARWTWSQSRPARGPQGPMPAVAWSDPSGSKLLVILPHDGVNRLAVLTGSSVALTGGDLLPGPPGAYAALQSALLGVTGIPSAMTW
jgi:hypothetical protein